MKTMSKFVWALALLFILTLPLASCIDRSVALSVSREVTAIPIAAITRGHTTSAQIIMQDALDKLTYPRQDIEGDKLVLGGTFTLEEGETLEGSLFLVGGAATLEEGSVIENDVMVLGGSLFAHGTIEGDVNVVGGLVTLGEEAVVEGDVNVLGGNLIKEQGAHIEGDVNTDIPGTFPFILPGRIQIPNLGEWMPIRPGDMRVPRFDITLNPFWDGLWLLFRSFLWAALSILVVLFLPKQSERAAGAAVSQPLVSGGLGCMTVVVAPLLLLLLAITICGVPVSLVGATILLIAWAFGIIVIGMEVGKRLSQLVKQDWTMPVFAGLGTFVLTLVINGIGALVPCIGWLAPAVVGVIGLGAVLLTRFGSQGYPPNLPLQSEQVAKSPSEQLSEQSTPPEEEHTPE